jgi:hypothetical protein
MNWQVRDYCVETELDAAQATAAGNNGQVLSTSAGVFNVQVGNVTETSIQYVLQNINTGAQTNRIVPFTAQECRVPPQGLTPEKAQALLVVWAAVLTMLSVIWGAKQIANLFRSGRGEA